MKINLKRIWVAGFAACLIFSANLAFAAPRSYQVEMIIFSHLTRDALNSERWSSTASAPNVDGLTPENQLSRPANGQLLLHNVRSRLNNTANYKVLLHLSWIMTSANPNQAIHIYGGRIYDGNGNAIGNVTNGDASFNGSNIWQVNGALRINLNRYFDVNINLVFAEPKSKIRAIANNGSIENSGDNFYYFSMKQHRRMRSSELNYLSMPMYGVLIKIFPLNAQ